MAKKTKAEKTPTTPTPEETNEELDRPELPAAAEPVAVNGKTNGKSKAGSETKPVDLVKSGVEAGSAKPLVVKSADAAKAKKKLPIWAWVVIGVVVLGALTGLSVAMFGGNTGVANTNEPQNTNDDRAIDGVPRAIDGVLVPENRSRTNTYAIMIENIAESRPPSGLNKASVVYEILAEGGITRFMALFPVGDEITEIGPVRSARKYYIPYAEEYKALYVHAGGSPNALDYLRLSSTNVVDFNQFRHGPNFWREKTRRAPHNLYTSTELLLRGLRDVAPDLVPTFTPWTFKEEPSFSALPETVKDIVINYSSFNYKATFKYDRAQNLYTRYQGDTEHVTKDGGKIQAKNVAVLFTKTGLLDGDKQRLDVTTIGEGKMLLFRDGTAIVGTWKKPSATDRTKFYDEAGQELALNPGVTWISVVPTDRTVEY